MEKSLYDRLLDLVARGLLNDPKPVYLHVLEFDNGVIGSGGCRYFGPLRARAAAVRDLNRYERIKLCLLAHRDGDDLVLYATSRVNKHGRHVGLRSYLDEPLHRRPIIAPMPAPGPRSRCSGLSERLAV